MPDLVSVNWYAQRALVAANDEARQTLLGIAYQMEAHAKVNIRENRQVDTGFMLNSVYVKSKEASGYALAEQTAMTCSQSSKGRGTVDHAGHMGPEVALPAGNVVGVAVGAIYAIFQEMRRSFLYRAAEQTARDFGLGKRIGRVR